MKGFVKEITTKIRYRDWLARLILPLVAAHYVLAINEPEPFWEFIQLPGYPISLLQNWVLTVLVFNLIYGVTKLLDRKVPWTKNFLDRLLFQVLFGIIVTSFITLILVYIFFAINGVDIFATNYLRLDWWFAVLFIVLANTYYIIQYLMRHVISEKRKQAQSTNTLDEVLVKDGNELIRIHARDITHIIVVPDATVVYAVGGQQHITDKSLTELDEELDPKQFYRIHRSQIINRNIVLGYGPASSNRLKLKTTIPEVLYVSQRYSAGFKKWWEGE